MKAFGAASVRGKLALSLTSPSGSRLRSLSAIEPRRRIRDIALDDDVAKRIGARQIHRHDIGEIRKRPVGELVDQRMAPQVTHGVNAVSVAPGEDLQLLFRRVRRSRALRRPGFVEHVADPHAARVGMHDRLPLNDIGKSVRTDCAAIVERGITADRLDDARIHLVLHSGDRHLSVVDHIVPDVERGFHVRVRLERDGGQRTRSLVGMLADPVLMLVLQPEQMAHFVADVVGKLACILGYGAGGHRNRRREHERVVAAVPVALVYFFRDTVERTVCRESRAIAADENGRARRIGRRLLQRKIDWRAGERVFEQIANGGGHLVFVTAQRAVRLKCRNVDIVDDDRPPISDVLRAVEVEIDELSAIG